MMLIMFVTCLVKTQLRLEAFYTFNERFAKIRSKRIKKAVKGITGNQTSELMDDPLQEVSKSRKKRRVSPVEPGDKNLKKPSKKIEENDVQNQINHMEKSTPKKSRKRRNVGEPVPSTEENLEPAMEAEGRRSQNRGSRGKGRGRGRGTGRGVGRGRGKRSSGFELCESSDDDSSDEQEVLVDKLEGPEEVRRVSYNLFYAPLIIMSKYHHHGVSATMPSFKYTLCFTIQFALRPQKCMLSKRIICWSLFFPPLANFNNSSFRLLSFFYLSVKAISEACELQCE